jgi:alkaline phosphatase
MKSLFLGLLLVASAFGEPRAKNVILFIGDAGGIPALHAGSLFGHNEPQKLFIQQMPHLALMDTSAANAWVTDSAAGMTAIVTGQKTNSGVLSQTAAAVRGKSDGERLKTILEYAEERGLSTGVVSNVDITDATPAACYAQVNDRGKRAEIFGQLLAPRFGDGVDVVIGAGKTRIFTDTEKAGMNIHAAIPARGYTLYSHPNDIPATARRVISLLDERYEAIPAVNRAIDILSRNPKGYFLMVEWDMHTNNLKRGLENVVEMDNVIREVAGRVGNDTLIIFTADHSFDIRVRGGKQGDSMLPEEGVENPKPRIRVENSHTGEQVLAAAKGPGAERIRGFIYNTDLFKVMMSAYGWRETAAPQPGRVAGGGR